MHVISSAVDFYVKFETGDLEGYSQSLIFLCPLKYKINLYVEIKCQLDAIEVFYCRSYCLLNMFRAPLCPSSGAQ